ncbi:S8 family serine peptidase [Anaerocolumna aminovalerica]|uniref:S8 family serine peptidase n=1 Tax=Anaerocolumna aminovalerica TaxID=1527 RepID=UPI001C0F1FE4|nr:S8 family serine peptidase [Anaerocolumna aminovalerica]MBU5334082.1 S8 family serine peptidase [Anaerocolumna aminovalerica]
MYIIDKHLSKLKRGLRDKSLKKMSILLVFILITQCLYGYNSFENDQLMFAKAKTDTQAPTTPSNLNYFIVSGPAINLVWDSSADNVGVEGYKVYKNDICIGQTDKTEYFYSELKTGEIYRFYITAYDKAGNESFKSDIINLPTDYPNLKEDKQPPTTPNNLTIVIVSGSAILLTWNVSSDDNGIEGYEIYKNGIILGFVKENSFIDYEFNFKSNDRYTVVAVDLSGNRSLESEGVTVKRQVKSRNPLENKTDRYIVKYKNSNGRKSLYSYLGTKIVNHKLMKGNIEVIELDKTMNSKDFIENIKSQKAIGNRTFYYNSDIEYIQPDYQFMSLSTDPYYNQQWGINDILADNSGFKDVSLLNDIIAGSNELNSLTNKNNDPTNNVNNISSTYSMDVNVEETWKQTKGEGVIVAIIDTGIDITQEDLRDNVYVNQSEIPNNGIDDDNNGLIDDINGWDFVNNSNIIHDYNNIYEEWHGTSVAGIVAAKDDNYVGITGVAPEAKILPLKVFQNGYAYTSDIIAAIEYAEKMGAKIVNCSWGSTENNPALKEAIDNSSMLFICAAGNNRDDMDLSPVFPAAYDNENIIAVASINSKGILSGFSNYGNTTVDIAAPGERIISTFPGNQYAFTSGTSMAAAFVSGEAALLYSLNEGFNSFEVKERILLSSDRLSSLTGKVLNGNKINCNNAVQNISSNEIIQIDAIDYHNYSSINSDINSDYNLYSSEIKTSLPFGYLDCVRAVAFNDSIYVTNSWGELYQYNPTTNRWSTKATMQDMSNPQSLVVVNGKIYAVGCLAPDRSYTILEYDPIKDYWTYKLDIPTEKEIDLFSAAVVNNVIYVMSGERDSAMQRVNIYDPITNIWSVKANMLSQRDDYASMAVIDDKIYFAGGWDNTMEAYDPLKDSWETKSSMTTARGFFGFVPNKGKLYALGGRNNATSLKSIEEYDPKTNSWSVSTCVLSMPRFGGSTVVLNNKIYIIGGYGNNYEYSKTIECITINGDDYGDDFSNATPISTGEGISGEINFAGDVDYFKFVALETTDYVLYGSGRYDFLYGEIYDSNHKFISATQDYGNLDFLCTVSLQAGKTYYLMVMDYYDVSFDEYAFEIIKKNSENKQMEYVYDSRGYLIEIKNNGTIRAYLDYDKNGNLIRIRSAY